MFREAFASKHSVTGHIAPIRLYSVTVQTGSPRSFKVNTFLIDPSGDVSAMPRPVRWCGKSGSPGDFPAPFHTPHMLIAKSNERTYGFIEPGTHQCSLFPGLAMSASWNAGHR
ncbi:hypothetical protein FE784_31690 [Paenibacillus hemerocallicola]|uniref:Uncharacterized protein n=1 Tax=Paenibacillus hemerocallicola TaxID=1172614 RepID=A0A5C4SZH7_9BACL|nr:hypothetical protein [Paenibacillus hemerocallicola]TNJ62248.1 hypothetical protein FE784_31690 [Paenibacillus hemerocallicola]